MGEKLGEAILELRTDDSQLTGGIAKAEGDAKGLARTFETASSQASSSLKSVGTAASQMATEAQTVARAATGGATAIRSAGMAAMSSRLQLMELSHVGTSLSGALIAGINPIRAFAMEMPRIAQAATLGQGGFLGMAKAVAGLLGPFTAILAPAGLLAAAFLGIKQSAASDAEIKQYAATLGLTEKEMKKLTDVTVTWGDTAKATWQVLLEKAGFTSEGVSSFFSKAFRNIGDFGKFAIAILVAGFAALVRFVASAANDVGLAIGKGIAFGVNKALDSIQTMINGVIAGVNMVSGVFKAMGVDLGTLNRVDLSRFHVEVQGNFTNPLKDAANQLHSTFNAVEGTFDAISARATKVSHDRLKAQADEIKGERDAEKATDGHTRAVKDHAKAVRDAAQAYDELAKRVQAVLDRLFPEEASARRFLQDLQDLRDYAAAGGISVDRLRQAIQRLTDEHFGGAGISDDILNAGPLTKDDTGALPVVMDQLEAMKGLAGPLADFFRSVPQNAAEMNVALQQIATKGLSQFNDGLANLLVNSKSLGDAWHQLGALVHSVAASMLEDMLRLVEQEAEMALFKMIFGSASLGGGTGGGLFGGFHAMGGLIPSGTFGIVGEKGPEPVIATPRGAMVLPNSSLRSGAGAANDRGTVFAPVFNNDFRGADAQAVAAIEARQNAFERQLPGQVVGIMSDARDRFVWRPR